MLNALERIANGYDSECERVRQDLAITESQLRDYRERLDKPFSHDAYLAELSKLRDQLKGKLSASAHESDKSRGPTASELAEQIKSLKTAHTIDAGPQRPRENHSTAEEPITARIRRRQEQNAEAEQSFGVDAAQNPLASPIRSKPPMTFQERIAIERQQNGEGQRPA